MWRIWMILLGGCLLAGCRHTGLDAQTVEEVSRAAAISSAVAGETGEPDGGDVADSTSAAVLVDLSLRDCVALAEQNGRSLARKRSEAERAGFDRDIAETEVFLPTLTASYKTTDDEDTGEGKLDVSYQGIAGFEIKPYLSLRQTETTGTVHSTSYGITVSRPLFALHEQIRRRLPPITRADKDILVADNNVRLERRQLEQAVTRAYYAVQNATARLGVRESRVNDSRDFLELTERRVENGFSPVDIVNATINLSQAQSDLLSEQTSIENALDVLKEVLGLELDRQLALAGFTPPARSNAVPDVDADLARMTADHETLVNQRLNIDFAEKEIGLLRDDVRPEVKLSFTAEQSAEGEEFFAEDEEDGDDYRLEVTYATTLDFKKARRAQLKKSIREQDERRLKLKDDEVRLGKELRAAARDVDQLTTRIGLAETRFGAEKDKLKATLARYERGNVDNLEVTRAKQAVDDAEISLLAARIALLNAEARYRALLPE